MGQKSIRSASASRSTRTGPRAGTRTRKLRADARRGHQGARLLKEARPRFRRPRLIERPAKDARITIFSARPGVVIGKKGEETNARPKVRRIMGAAGAREHRGDPQAGECALMPTRSQQLEKRIMFRREKRAMQNAMRLARRASRS
jgi:hypothetical protein